MTDSAFAAPGSAPGPLPGLVRGLAITIIVLGVLGALQGLFGVFGLFLTASGAVAIEAPPNLPFEMRDAYADLMEAQQGLAVYSAFPTVLSGLISVFMVIAGIQTMTTKRIGMLPYAALGAAGADLISMVLMQIVNYLLMQSEFDAYFNALTALGGGPEAEMIGQMASAGMLGGILFAVVLGLAFVGFWIWAYTALAGHARRTGEA